MNYIITGGTGFIGTHLTNLIKSEHPDAEVWNLDIVEPKDGERKNRFVCCDVRKPIVELPFTLAQSGYPFQWTFKEALEDWFKDNDGKGLQ